MNGKELVEKIFSDEIRQDTAAAIIDDMDATIEKLRAEIFNDIVSRDKESTSNDFAYKSIEDFEGIIGQRITNDAFRAGFEMARKTKR